MKSNQSVHNAIVWQDRRTSEIIDALSEDERALIKGKTGLVADSYFSASKIKWMLDIIPGLRRRAEQGEQAALGAYIYIENNGALPFEWKPVKKGRNIRLLIPHYISGENDVKVYARVRKPLRNVTIKFPEIARKDSRKAVMPGEMIMTRLRKQELNRVKGKVTMEAIV